MFAAGGQLSFDTSGRFRSSEFSQVHVLGLYRLANYLEDTAEGSGEF